MWHFPSAFSPPSNCLFSLLRCQSCPGSDRSHWQVFSSLQTQPTLKNTRASHWFTNAQWGSVSPMDGGHPTGGVVKGALSWTAAQSQPRPAEGNAWKPGFLLSPRAVGYTTMLGQSCWRRGFCKCRLVKWGSCSGQVGDSHDAAWTCSSPSSLHSSQHGATAASLLWQGSLVLRSCDHRRRLPRAPISKKLSVFSSGYHCHSVSRIIYGSIHTQTHLRLCH
jgi:hypothetical protein